jgi:hypothetical protein
MMVFRPKAFALRLRMDEPLSPPIVVFVLILFLYGVRLVRWNWWGLDLWLETLLLYGLMAAVTVAFALAFAGGSVRAESTLWDFKHRFRFWCAILGYSSIFLAAWWLFGAGTWRLEWSEYTTDWSRLLPWPSNQPPFSAVLLAWWTLVLGVVLWYRNRPRWLALAFLVVALFYARVAIHLADGFIPRLSRS